MKPISINRKDRGIEVEWENKESSFLSNELLRAHCPCASCLQKRGDTSHQKPLTSGRASLQVIEATAEEETNLVRLWAVGNYAIGALWGDKHDTGIYSFSYLYELASKDNK